MNLGNYYKGAPPPPIKKKSKILIFAKKIFLFCIFRIIDFIFWIKEKAINVLLKPIIDLFLIKDRKRWKQENFEFGKQLGYPDCCINAFCHNSPKSLKIYTSTEIQRQRYQASLIDGKYSGFIPCEKHAKQILNKEIELSDLVTRRNPLFPDFPNL